MDDNCERKESLFFFFAADLQTVLERRPKAGCCVTSRFGFTKKVWRTAENATLHLQSFVERHGYREDDDEYEKLEFSVFRLIHESDNDKVELEDAENEEMSEVAWNRWLELFLPIIPVGCFLWGAAVLIAVLLPMLELAGDASAKVAYIPLFLGVCVQVAVLEYMFRLVTRSTVEGRPFIRFISQDGKYMCLMGVGFAILDFMGTFTRAMFVGQAVRCSFLEPHCAVDEMWVDFLAKKHSIFLPLVQRFGFGGFSVLLWVIGPVIIQGGIMLMHLRAFLKELTRCNVGPEGTSMGMSEVFDDLGAVANWAMLKPIGKLFSCAAVPLELVDENDAFRIWDKIKTDSLETLADLLPDSMFQSLLMTLHLMLSYHPWVGTFFPPFTLINKLFSIFCALASVFLSIATMVDLDRRLTMLVGGILLAFAMVNIGMLFYIFACGGFCE